MHGGNGDAGNKGVLPDLSRTQVSARTVLAVLLTAFALVGTLYLLYELRQLVQWVIIALFLAVALAPAVDVLHRRHVPRVLAILVVYLLLLLALVGLGALFLPPLISQVQQLAAEITRLARQPGGAYAALQSLANRYGLGSYLTSLRGQVSALPGRLGSVTGPLLSVTQGIVTSITALISIAIVTFFLLLDGDRFATAILSLAARDRRPLLWRLFARSAAAVRGYITGNLLISLIAGVAAFIGLQILGLPYAAALGLVVALLDLIPLVGATLAGIILVIVAFFISPIKAIILIVYFIVYQQVESNILQPLIYGRSVELPPLVVFLAVLAGGELLGILGALIAIPIAEIARIIGAEWLASRRGEPGPLEQSAAEGATGRPARRGPGG